MKVTGFITSTFWPEMVNTLVSALYFSLWIGGVLALAQLVSYHEAHIVPGVFVFLPRVAQADQDPVHPAGSIFQTAYRSPQTV